MIDTIFISICVSIYLISVQLMRIFVRNHNDIHQHIPIISMLGTLLPLINTLIVILIYTDKLIKIINFKNIISWLYKKFFNI
jgi:uncharacterized membrane protein